MVESFGKLSEAPRFEHKDISGERRLREKPESIRAEFFFNLMDETLRNYDEVRRANPGKETSPLQNVEFFFKKSWDKFAEPVLEYEDMLADIMVKKWESKGAKSRALAALKEARVKTLNNIKILIPDFETLDAARQKKDIAKLYEGYASFIHDNEERFGALAKDVNKDFSRGLRSFLHTKDDELLRRDVEVRLIEEKRKREARKARQSQNVITEGSIDEG